MDFDFSTEHKQLRDTVRRHAEDDMRPHVSEADDTERFPKELFARWGELGLIGARYPEADGGVGMDKISDCICLLYTSPSPRDRQKSRMPSSA